jgi:hypothetical protein
VATGLRDEVKGKDSGGLQLALGALLFVLGCGWVAAGSAQWYSSQQVYALNYNGDVVSLVQQYFIVELFALGVVVAGAWFTRVGLVKSRQRSYPDSIRRLLGDALSSRRDVAVGVAAAIAYGAAYLFISGVVVFQPGANYGAWEGITGPGWTAAACCGSMGTVPALIVYVAPQQHLALQILPLDVLFAVVVPLLVGFNVTVAAHALRERTLRSNAGWVGSLGVLVGLFTGCPTCAGLFLAGAVGGLGATSLAIALAPYQALFVVVSIPLLAASPLFITLNARRSLRASCPVPTPSGPPPQP